MKHFIFFFSFCLFFVITYCFYDPFSYILYYKEQHSLFLYTTEYFNHIINNDGILSYLSNFLIQFFYHPLLGSSLLAFLYTGIYSFLTISTSKLTQRFDILQLPSLLSLYLFLQTTSVDSSFDTTIGFFICSFCYFLSILLFKNKTKWIVLFSSFFFLSLFISWKINSIILIVISSSSISSYYLNKLKHIRDKKLFYSSSIALILLLFSFFYIKKKNHSSEKTMVLIQKKATENRWDEVLKETQTYLQTKKTNQLILYFYNLSLAHTNKMESQLFNVSQSLGLSSLYFSWEGDSRKSEFGHYLYEALGYINEAHRWDFESMVVWGETAPILIRLIRYNILNNRPKVAQRFINILKKSLYYQKEALYYQNNLTKKQFPFLVPTKQEATDQLRFSNVVNVLNEFHFIANNDPMNKIATDYFLCGLLLSNQVEKFVQNLYRLKNYNVSTLPFYYQEALLIYELGAPRSSLQNLDLDFNIDPIIKQRFQRYYSLYKGAQLKQLQKEFSNSYWYYLHFTSPYGNKIKTH